MERCSTTGTGGSGWDHRPVGEVARAREGNPNVLHRWRREFRQGRLRHDSVGFAASNFGPQTSDDSAGTSGCNVGRVLDGSTRED